VEITLKIQSSVTLAILSTTLISPLAAGSVFTHNPPRTIWIQAESLAIDELEVEVDEVQLTGCDDVTWSIVVDEEIDLAQGWEMQVPADGWCEVSLLFDGLEAVTQDGSVLLSPQADVATSTLDDGITVLDLGVELANTPVSVMVEVIEE